MKRLLACIFCILCLALASCAAPPPDISDAPAQPAETGEAPQQPAPAPTDDAPAEPLPDVDLSQPLHVGVGAATTKTDFEAGALLRVTFAVVVYEEETGAIRHVAFNGAQAEMTAATADALALDALTAEDTFSAGEWRRQTSVLANRIKGATIQDAPALPPELDADAACLSALQNAINAAVRSPITPGEDTALKTAVSARVERSASGTPHLRAACGALASYGDSDTGGFLAAPFARADAFISEDGGIETTVDIPEISVADDLVGQTFAEAVQTADAFKDDFAVFRPLTNTFTMGVE